MALVKQMVSDPEFVAEQLMPLSVEMYWVLLAESAPEAEDKASWYGPAGRSDNKKTRLQMRHSVTLPVQLLYKPWQDGPDAHIGNILNPSYLLIPVQEQSHRTAVL